MSHDMKLRPSPFILCDQKLALSSFLVVKTMVDDGSSLHENSFCKLVILVNMGVVAMPIEHTKQVYMLSKAMFQRNQV